MISGLNHITIAVSNVQTSLDFYTQILGFTGHVVWESGAYLSINGLWVCLSKDTPSPAQDYSHIAWSVEADKFEDIKRTLLSAGVRQWKTNKSEGDSLYCLDPDGNKFEIHVGSLEQRLASLKTAPYKGLRWL